MTALADTHVHLLAGLDDGPETEDVALSMCRMLVAEGVREATALAHQNYGYPDNTPERLVAAATQLQAALASHSIPLVVHPAAEVMLSPSLAADWKADRLLSMGNHRQWLLVEMPHGRFVDALPFAESLRAVGVRLVIAHAERYPELLHDPALTAMWIAAGCLIQVTARSIAEPPTDEVERGLRHWLTGGFVQVLGSDGHGIDRRQPRLSAGYRSLAKLVGRRAAARIGSTWGTAILQGKAIAVPPPQPPGGRWFTRLFGS